MKRRAFMRSVGAGAALALAPQAGTAAEQTSASSKKIKVGVIGCGSVSEKYFPNLAKSPFVELVSCCDIRYERAKNRAAEFKVPNTYPNIDAMLSGAPFDMLVDLTDMQEHEHLNRQALEAGKHVWSEKPMANSVAAGRELLELAAKKGVRLWGAPTVVTSPQFAFMAKTLAEGKLGHVAAAYASYGHLGPDWSPFFYQKGGGSLPDLGVYNLTTLTGLLGPAKAVTAMTSIVTPERTCDGKKVKVEAEDNAIVTIDHGNSTLSVTLCGFNFFTSQQHDFADANHQTISITGTQGSMHLVGYDWAPHGVDLATREEQSLKRYATDTGGYVWQWGASLAAECLATGKELLVTPEHALHIIEVMLAANESQRTGKRIEIETTFKWPVIA